MKREEYDAKMAALEPMDEGRRKAVTCALLGLGHNCPTCRANYEKLGWEDKVLCPDPFEKGGDEDGQVDD